METKSWCIRIYYYKWISGVTKVYFQANFHLYQKSDITPITSWHQLQIWFVDPIIRNKVNLKRSYCFFFIILCCFLPSETNVSRILESNVNPIPPEHHFLISWLKFNIAEFSNSKQWIPELWTKSNYRFVKKMKKDMNISITRAISGWYWNSTALLTNNTLMLG